MPSRLLCSCAPEVCSWPNCTSGFGARADVRSFADDGGDAVDVAYISVDVEEVRVCGRGEEEGFDGGRRERDFD